jgi:pimeloyl-ACP methyl ester carboxylesterase
MDMKDLDIDDYLGELIVAIDDLGDRVNQIGLCQGGWLSTMVAARFSEKVNCLLLAGAPIDTHSGNGPIKRMVRNSPISFYEELVALGGGLMKGQFVLQGWQNMHPRQHYIRDHIDLHEQIDDPGYIAKEEPFESRYENPMNLPGRWYLQAIVQLFKENLPCKGQFVELGHQLDLKRIHCPVYLLAGVADDITTPEQVFNALRYLGTPQGGYRKETRAWRSHWPFHGVADSERAVASDRRWDLPPLLADGWRNTWTWTTDRSSSSSRVPRFVWPGSIHHGPQSTHLTRRRRSKYASRSNAWTGSSICFTPMRASHC